MINFISWYWWYMFGKSLSHSLITHVCSWSNGNVQFAEQWFITLGKIRKYNILLIFINLSLNQVLPLQYLCIERTTDLWTPCGRSLWQRPLYSAAPLPVAHWSRQMSLHASHSHHQRARRVLLHRNRKRRYHQFRFRLSRRSIHRLRRLLWFSVKYKHDLL